MTRGMKDQFELLLEDQDLEVMPKLVPQLGELVEVFEEIRRIESETPNRDTKDPKEKDRERDFTLRSKDIMRSYLDAVVNIWKFLIDHHMWRLEITLMKDLPRYYEMYSLKELNDKNRTSVDQSDERRGY